MRALAKEIAAGRLDLLEHGPWVPAEFLEATMRTATGSGTAALRVCAVAHGTNAHVPEHSHREFAVHTCVHTLRYIHVYQIHSHVLYYTTYIPELSPHTITDETLACFITCCGDSLLRLHANGCHKVTDATVKAACKLCTLLRHVGTDILVLLLVLTLVLMLSAITSTNTCTDAISTHASTHALSNT